jgi:hypothetical protein
MSPCSPLVWGGLNGGHLFRTLLAQGITRRQVLPAHSGGHVFFSATPKKTHAPLQRGV